MSKPTEALARLAAAAEQGVPASVEDAHFAAKMYALAQARYEAGADAHSWLRAQLWRLYHATDAPDATSPYRADTAEAWALQQMHRGA